MKKGILLLGLFLAFMQSVYGDDSIVSVNNSTTSKVVVYRESNFLGSAISYKIFSGDSLLVKLKNNSYFIYSCSPGVYDIHINKLSNMKVHLKVEPGKTYYLRFDLRIGFWSSVPELSLIDSISAYPAIHNGSMRLLDKQNTPLVRPKNRFGMNLNLGGGFDNSTWATTSDGKEATTSFGGGFALGLKYGHEFSQHFDLAFDLNYQSSLLIPSLSNGNVTFNRGILSVTPSYIVPIDGGDAMRLKFGAGIDSYFGSNLSIELSKMSGGFDDNWTYKNSFGYHLSAIFEQNISDKWSLNYGLKWYTVSYTFDKGGISYPTDSKIKSPNGSGIDFLFGVYYHF